MHLLADELEWMRNRNCIFYAWSYLQRFKQRAVATAADGSGR